MLPPAQNAAFVCQLARVLDVYQRPYAPAWPVVCLQESPQHLLAESRPPLVLADGRTRYDGADPRRGVAQVYRRAEPRAGRRRGQGEDRHDRLTFARVVARLRDEAQAQARRVTLVLDQLPAQQPAACYEGFDPARAHALWQRVEVVFTPEHGSWLNRAESEFAALRPHGLPERVADRPTLEAHAQAWQEARNQRGGTHHLAVHHGPCPPQTQAPLPDNYLDLSC